MKRMESSIPAKRARASSSSSQQPGGASGRGGSKQRRSNNDRGPTTASKASNAPNTRASTSSSSSSSSSSSTVAATATATTTSSPTRSRRQNAGQRRPVFDPTPPALLRRVSGGADRMGSPARQTPPPLLSRQQKSSNDSSNSPSPLPSAMQEDEGQQAEEQPLPQQQQQPHSSPRQRQHAKEEEEQDKSVVVMESTRDTVGPTNLVQEAEGVQPVSTSSEPSGKVAVEAPQQPDSPGSDITKRSFYGLGRGSAAAEAPRAQNSIQKVSYSRASPVPTTTTTTTTTAPSADVVHQPWENVEDEKDKVRVEPEATTHMAPSEDAVMETNQPEMTQVSALSAPSPATVAVAPAVITTDGQPLCNSEDLEYAPTQELNEPEPKEDEAEIIVKEEAKEQEEKAKKSTKEALAHAEQQSAVHCAKEEEGGDGMVTMPSTTTGKTTAAATTETTITPSPPIPEATLPSIPSHLADDFAPDSPRKSVTYSPSKQDQQKKFEPIKNAHQPKSILKKTPARPIFVADDAGGDAHHSSGARGNVFATGGSGSGSGSTVGGMSNRRRMGGQAAGPAPLSIGPHEEFVKDACKTLERTEDAEGRAMAYQILQSKLRICDDQRHMPEFQASIRQYAKFFARDLAVVDQPLLLQYCLRCAGFFLFHPQTVNMLTGDEVETLLSRIVTIAETTTDRSLCSMALYCLGIQQTPLRLWQQRAVFSTIVPTMVQAMNARARSNSVVHEALKSLLNVFHHRPDEMARHLDVWLVPVCLDLLHAVPGIRSKALDIITFALPHLVVLESGLVQRALRGFVQEKYDEFFKRLDEKHIQNGDEIYGITVWGCMVSLLGKYLQKTAQLNPVLKIAERCFNSNSPERTEIVMAAFQAWTRFIYVMANCGNLAQERAVQLMMTPIKSCFATENRRRVRLACTNTWIALVFALDSKLPLFHMHVLTPIIGKVLRDDSEHVRDLGLRFLKALFAGEGGDKILEGEAFNLHGAKYRNSKPAWSDLAFLRTRLIHVALSSLGGAFMTQHRVVDSSRDQWKVDDTTELNLVTMPLAHAWESIVTAICTINNNEKDIRVSAAAVSSLQALLKFARDVSRMDPALLMPKDWPAREQPQFALLTQDRELAGLILRADITFYLLSTIIQAFSYRTLMAGRYRVADDLHTEIQQALAQGQESSIEGKEPPHTTAAKGSTEASSSGGGGLVTAAGTLSKGPALLSSSSSSSSSTEPRLLTPFEYILKTWMDLGESVIKTPFDNWFWEGVASMTNYVMGDTQPMRMLFRCFHLLKDIERKRQVAKSDVLWPAWNHKAHPLLFYELQLKYFSLIAKRLSDAMENKMACDKVNACTTPEDDENIMTILMYPGYIFQSTAKWAESEALAPALETTKMEGVEGGDGDGHAHNNSSVGGDSGQPLEMAEHEVHTAQWWQSYRAIYFASWKELVQRWVESKQCVSAGTGNGEKVGSAAAATAMASTTATASVADGHETLNLLATRLRTAFVKFRRTEGRADQHAKEDRQAHQQQEGGGRLVLSKNAGQTWYFAHACVSACGLVEIMRWIGPTDRPGPSGLFGRREKQPRKKRCTLELIKWLFHMAPTASMAVSWMLACQEQGLAPWFEDPGRLLPRVALNPSQAQAARPLSLDEDGSRGNGHEDVVPAVQMSGEDGREGNECDNDLNELWAQCMEAMDLAWHSIATRLKEHAKQTLETHRPHRDRFAHHYRGGSGGGGRWLGEDDADIGGLPPMVSAAGSILPPTLSKIRAAAATAAEAHGARESMRLGASPFLVRAQPLTQGSHSRNTNNSGSSLQFDSAGLEALKPLWVATLGSTRKAIVEQAIECWNLTFGLLEAGGDEKTTGEHGEGTVLEYPPELFVVLRSLKQVAKLSLPDWRVAEERHRAARDNKLEVERKKKKKEEEQVEQEKQKDEQDNIQRPSEDDKTDAQEEKEEEKEGGWAASQSSAPIPVFASQPQELSVPAELMTRTTTIGRQIQKRAAVATAAAGSPTPSTVSTLPTKAVVTASGVAPTLSRTSKADQQQHLSARYSSDHDQDQPQDNDNDSNTTKKRKLHAVDRQQAPGPQRNPLMQELETMQELLKSPSPPVFKAGRSVVRPAMAGLGLVRGGKEEEEEEDDDGKQREKMATASSSSGVSGRSRLARLTSRRALSIEAMSATQDDPDEKDDDDDDDDVGVMISSPTKKRGMMMTTTTQLVFAGSRSRGGQAPRQQQQLLQKPAKLARANLVPLKAYDPQNDPVSSSPSLPFSTLSPTMESAETGLELEQEEMEEEENEGGYQDDGVDGEVTLEREEEVMQQGDQDDEQQPDVVMQHTPVDETVFQEQEQQPPVSEDEVMTAEDANEEAILLPPREDTEDETPTAVVAATNTTAAAATATAAGFLAMLDEWVEQSPRVVSEMDTRQLHAVQDRLQRLSHVVSQEWGKRLS
ncbi:DNA-binding protein rif1 [Actinomortierella ambigua]|nr:DNA-binding protein rif1 [Actinomortierella ambigua]